MTLREDMKKNVTSINGIKITESMTYLGVKTTLNELKLSTQSKIRQRNLWGTCREESRLKIFN